MKSLKIFSTIPETTYVFIFVMIIVLSSSFAYFQIEEATALNKKIAGKQKELAATVALKDIYLAKKRAMDAITSKSTEEKAASLGLIEEITTKTFVAGRLSSLKPTASKEERGKTQVMFELKVSGAALGEVITFTKEVEASGLYVKKLHLSMPSTGQTFVDMYATITAG